MKIKDYIKIYGYENGFEKIKQDNKASKRLLKYINMYGIINGINLYIQNVCNKNAVTLDKFIKKYGEEEGTKKYNEWKNNCSISLDKFIKKYGEEEGIKRYNKWKDNQKNNKLTSLDKFIKKYGEEEGIKRYNKWKESLDNSSLKSFIKKYGEEEGTKRYNKYVRKMSKSVKKSMRPGIMKYINSIQYYIDKYGKEDGIKRYNKWKKSQDHGSLPFFIQKYGEEEGLKRYNQVNYSKIHNMNKTYYSKISQELFKILDLKLNTNENIFFAEKNIELSLYNNEYNERYFYDFCYKNKIIEYNGDFWHANPKIYNESDIISKNKKAKDIWDYDNRKQNFAKSQGYKIFVVWDADYQHDKLKIINDCLNFLLTQ